LFFFSGNKVSAPVEDYGVRIVNYAHSNNYNGYCIYIYNTVNLYSGVVVRPISSVSPSYPFVIDNSKFWEELIACFPWYDTGHIENDASNNYSIVACIFVTAVTFLPCRCLATIGGFLPSRRLAIIGRFLPTRCLATVRGFYRAVSLKRQVRYTRRQQRDLISLFYFFKISIVG
jgi:hypothetical protein